MPRGASEGSGRWGTFSALFLWAETILPSPALAGTCFTPLLGAAPGAGTGLENTKSNLRLCQPGSGPQARGWSSWQSMAGPCGSSRPWEWCPCNLLIPCISVAPRRAHAGSGPVRPGAARTRRASQKEKTDKQDKTGPRSQGVGGRAGNSHQPAGPCCPWLRQTDHAGFNVQGMGAVSLQGWRPGGGNLKPSGEVHTS